MAPIVYNCLFNGRWPIIVPIIVLRFFLSRYNKCSDSRLFNVGTANFNCLQSVSYEHHVQNYENGSENGRSGYGPATFVSELLLASSSAASLS